MPDNQHVCCWSRALDTCCPDRLHHASHQLWQPASMQMRTLLSMTEPTPELTPWLCFQGEDLALRLYRDGVTSDRITWRIPGVSLDQGPQTLSQPQGLSQPQAAPSPALPRAPSQAFRSATNTSQGRGSQNRPTPPSGGGSQANPHRGRALEPEGAVSSPRQSWHATSSSRPSAAQPNGTAVRAAPIHCDLLSHPSSSFQVAEDMPDLATRLSQSVTQSRPLTQIAPQRGPVRHPTGAEAPLDRHASTEKPPVRSRNAEQILRVMQIAECSYNKAKRVKLKRLLLADSRT